MYISMVEFTVGPEDKEKFAAKIERDTETLKTVNGVLSTEAWISERATKTTYALITKWESEEAQKTWINRPEHVAHHKKMSQQRRENPGSISKIEKRVSGYHPF
jgi:heme-degrading monooxygenase HmoA